MGEGEVLLTAATYVENVWCRQHLWTSEPRDAAQLWLWGHFPRNTPLPRALLCPPSVQTLRGTHCRQLLWSHYALTQRRHLTLLGTYLGKANIPSEL